MSDNQTPHSRYKTVIVTAFIGAVLSAIVGVVFSFWTKDTLEVCFSGSESEVQDKEDGIFVSEVFVKNTGSKQLENIFLRIETEISEKSTENPKFKIWVTSFQSCEQPKNTYVKRKRNPHWRAHRSEFTCNILNPGEYLTYHVKYNKNSPNITSKYSPMHFNVVFKADGLTIKDNVSTDHPELIRFACN